MIPFLAAAILLSFFGLQRSKWQQAEGLIVTSLEDQSDGMSYLESWPAAR